MGAYDDILNQARERQQRQDRWKPSKVNEWYRMWLVKPHGATAPFIAQKQHYIRYGKIDEVNKRIKDICPTFVMPCETQFNEFCVGCSCYAISGQNPAFKALFGGDGPKQMGWKQTFAIHMNCIIDGAFDKGVIEYRTSSMKFLEAAIEQANRAGYEDIADPWTGNAIDFKTVPNNAGDGYNFDPVVLCPQPLPLATATGWDEATINAVLGDPQIVTIQRYEQRVDQEALCQAIGMRMEALMQGFGAPTQVQGPQTQRQALPAGAGAAPPRPTAQPRRFDMPGAAPKPAPVPSPVVVPTPEIAADGEIPMCYSMPEIYDPSEQQCIQCPYFRKCGPATMQAARLAGPEAMAMLAAKFKNKLVK